MRGIRIVFVALSSALLASFMLATASAQTPERQRVDLRLVLAVDASGSVSQARFQLQKQGYVRGIADPKVINAIGAGINGSIAVTMFQWTGARLQAEVIPWMVVRDEASAKAASEAIDAVPRRLFGGGTSLSGAIDYSMAKLAASPFASDRQVIDISGDGSNNSGRSSRVARDEALSKGVIINGLPILTVEPDLDDYYRDNVIGGEGSFVIAIQRFEDFADAIVRKLIAEIALNDYRKTLGGPTRRRM